MYSCCVYVCCDDHRDLFKPASLEYTFNTRSYFLWLVSGRYCFEAGDQFRSTFSCFELFQQRRYNDKHVWSVSMFTRASRPTGYQADLIFQHGHKLYLKTLSIEFH